MKKTLYIALICLIPFFTACSANNSRSQQIVSAAEPKPTVSAQTTAKYYEPMLLGEFSTKYNAKNKPRVTNLTLASEAIDGTVVNPGEIFSYNETVGPTNKARGYKSAKIIVKGVEKKGYGGGVCQVSSTLFNAVEAAGLKVVERHPHSKEVLYVETGRDAATSYGSLDFKFENTMDYPVEIWSAVEDGVIDVAIVSI